MSWWNSCESQLENVLFEIEKKISILASKQSEETIWPLFKEIGMTKSINCPLLRECKA